MLGNQAEVQSTLGTIKIYSGVNLCESDLNWKIMLIFKGPLDFHLILPRTITNPLELQM